jgi:hypothetical protein
MATTELTIFTRVSTWWHFDAAIQTMKLTASWSTNTLVLPVRSGRK